MTKNTKRTILLIIFVVILIFLIVIFLKYKEPKKTNINFIDICQGLDDRNKGEVSFDSLKENITFDNRLMNQDGVYEIFDLPEFTSEEIDGLISVISQYSVSKWGDAYRKFNISISPSHKEANIYISIGAYFDDKKQENCINTIVNEASANVLYDYCIAGGTGVELRVHYFQDNNRKYIFDNPELIQYSDYLSIPNDVEKCAIALLEQDEQYLKFMDENKSSEVSWGISSWELVDGKYIVYGSARTSSFKSKVIGFKIDPFNSNIVFNGESIDNWAY